MRKPFSGTSKNSSRARATGAREALLELKEALVSHLEDASTPADPKPERQI